MNFAAVSFRTAAVATIALAAASVAQAQLTIPFGFTNSNSTQTFTDDNLASFDLVNLTVSAAGNTTATGPVVVGESSGTQNSKSFAFPITKIVIGSKLNIASGSAVGSALKFDRLDVDTGLASGFTLANFTIDYDKKLVLADVTPKGGVVALQQPIYLFNVATPLALKYKFPLTVTGNELLDQLMLSPSAKTLFKTALQLPEFAEPALDFEFGTLKQDISTTLRKTAISTKPYVAK
ncbi:hypothetical protein [Aquabacterium sp.]|uniref:hypothetical protein n=1 Tax=Aquabacterium sp. TaxID=1872578 RepID=UPI001D70FD9F|nr:hypothetical protein [Aquabacterium sp.]MBT9609695.1 hypothetical protein [Aquabacterium sp.]